MFNQLYQQPKPTFEILTKLVSTSYTYWIQLYILWQKDAIPSAVVNFKPIAAM